MATVLINHDRKHNFRQLEWLVIAMSGCTFGSIQIIHYFLFNPGTSFAFAQSFFDWLFCMAIVSGLIHFSFKEINKMQGKIIQTSDEANQAESKMKHIIDNSEDAIFTIAKNGNFNFCSKAIEQLTGYDCKDILKLNINDVVSDKYNSFVMKQIYQSSDYSPRHLYIDLRKKDGNLVPVEISFVPLRDKRTGVINFQGIAKDITTRKSEENAQLDKEQYLNALAEVGQVLVESNNAIPFENTIQILCNTTGSYMACIYFKDLNTASRLNVPQLIKWNDTNYCLDGCPESTNQELIDNLTNIMGDLEMAKLKENTYFTRIREKTNVVIFPILTDSKLVALIGFYKESTTDSWKPENINLMKSGVNMISQAIDKQISCMQLKKYFLSLAKTISNVLFFSDPFTAKHQQKLAEMACIVGEKIGLNPKQLEWIYFAGLLHDIGKAAIPGTILSKPGKLTDEEWILMRSHVKRGYEMLKEMKLPEYVIEMVSHHHERIDGSGYPEGITGEKLSLESRILGICDVVEAMGSHRPYRPAHDVKDIILELNSGKGTKYDDNLTDLVIGLIQAKELCS